MNLIRRTLATLEVVLIFPAVLFMMALFVRSVQPRQFEPAHTAQRIVDWYAARIQVGLWLFLMAFPLAVLSIGCVSLVRAGAQTPHCVRQGSNVLERSAGISPCWLSHWPLPPRL